jgi:glycosyltransferase involved in cell wall biosynthesis
VLANRHAAQAVSGLGAPVHEVSSYRTGRGAAGRALAMAAARALPRRAARDVPPGLDVLHYPLTVGIPRLPLPTLVTVHDVRHLAAPGSGPAAWRRYRAAAYDGPAREADVVVVLSEYARAVLAERGVAREEALAVVAPGVDHEVFSPAAPDGGDRLPPLPERFVVYPANAWPHKNHDRLLQALARVPDPDLALVLAGAPGRRATRLTERARALGLEHRVRHLGHLAPARLAAVYRRARALVFPSLHEAFGLPPLEAMACGCPVAASDREGLVEACGDAALAFDPSDVDALADAIERVAGDDELRSRLARAGTERAAGFRWETAAAAHAALYARAGRAQIS